MGELLDDGGSFRPSAGLPLLEGLVEDKAGDFGVDLALEPGFEGGYGSVAGDFVDFGEGVGFSVGNLAVVVVVGAGDRLADSVNAGEPGEEAGTVVAVVGFVDFGGAADGGEVFCGGEEAAATLEGDGLGGVAALVDEVGEGAREALGHHDDDGLFGGEWVELGGEVLDADEVFLPEDEGVVVLVFWVEEAVAGEVEEEWVSGSLFGGLGDGVEEAVEVFGGGGAVEAVDFGDFEAF